MLSIYQRSCCETLYSEIVEQFSRIDTVSRLGESGKVHRTPSFHRRGSDDLDALSESFSSYMQFKRIRYVDLKWMV